MTSGSDDAKHALVLHGSTPGAGIADRQLVLAASGGPAGAVPGAAKTQLTPEELERKLKHINDTVATRFASNTGSTAGQGSGAHALYNKHRRLEEARVKAMEQEAADAVARADFAAAQAKREEQDEARLKKNQKKRQRQKMSKERARANAKRAKMEARGEGVTDGGADAGAGEAAPQPQPQPQEVPMPAGPELD